MTRAFILIPAMLLAGCAAISEQDQALLTGEIDCERAEATITEIRRARPTDLDRARILATTLTPGGFLLGLATNDFRDRERLMSGAYDEELTARLREIGETCDIAVPELA